MFRTFEKLTVGADRKLTSLEGECRSAADQRIHRAHPGQTETVTSGQIDAGGNTFGTIRVWPGDTGNPSAMANASPFSAMRGRFDMQNGQLFICMNDVLVSGSSLWVVPVS